MNDCEPCPECRWMWKCGPAFQKFCCSHDDICRYPQACKCRGDVCETCRRRIELTVARRWGLCTRYDQVPIDGI